MKTPQIDLADEDFGLIVLSAMRYCIGRRTYMPEVFTNFVNPLLPYLSDKTIFLLERDIREQAQYGENAYGDPVIDKPVWDNFYQKVYFEQYNRKNQEKFSEYT